MATLAGRNVEMRQAGFATFWDAQEAIVESGGVEKTATYAVLSAAAFWADTGERVFASWRAVSAWPMEDSHDLITLLGIAAEMNNPTVRPAKANGTVEAAAGEPGPSP